MLNQLYKFARDKEIDSEPGFKPKEVHWLAICDSKGKFFQVVRLSGNKGKKNSGRVFNKCPEFSFSELKSGGKTKSHYLVESIKHVTLLGIEEKDKKAEEKFNYFVFLLEESGKVFPEAASIASCLKDEKQLKKIQSQLEDAKAQPNEKITFKVDEKILVESPEWHDWWREFREKQGKKVGKEEKMRCFITGELVIPSKTHPKIEGLTDVGGNSAGTSLIGFNKSAFCSYGLKQSQNAAVGERAAYMYKESLNLLIKNNSQRLGNVKIVHWYKEKISPEEDPLSWMDEDEEKKELNAKKRAEELLTSIKTGKKPDLANNYYYAITLSGSGGRAMARDWIEGQFENLVSNIFQWFKDLEIVNPDGKSYSKGPSWVALQRSILNQKKRQELPAPLVSKLLRVIIQNEKLPGPIVVYALDKFRNNLIQGIRINPHTVGIIKAYILRFNQRKGGAKMGEYLKENLNPKHPNPAYHCGRLMAVLSQLQKSALGEVGAGVIQRYYTSASSTPALVLGRLTKTSQYHLNKLSGGLTHWYEGKLSEIWVQIGDSIPLTLNLEEQSLFALGYYQQMADLRTKKQQEDDLNE